MKSFDDPQVCCPYDKNHKMPYPRLQWHLVKCKSKLERQKLGLDEFHCKFNYMHIFFSKDELNEHQANCELKVNAKIDERLQVQKEINDNMEKGEDAPKNDLLFNAYRESQGEDCRGDKFTKEQGDVSDLSEIEEDEIGEENF